jgi:serine/threonine-protein kinase RsbW
MPDGAMHPGFRMSIGAELGDVARVHAAFAQFAEAHAVPAAVRRSMNVVLDELLANTVTYGLADQVGGSVTVDVELHRDRLAITLTDDGKRFDPFGRAAPDTTLSVEDRPIGGLGIHLVRQLVDEVSYHRHGDHNVVVLVKRLAGGMTEAQRGGRVMQISTRTRDEVTIVAIEGSLDSITSADAQRALDAVLTGGGRKIAIDFTALDYISSAGLRVLLGTAKQLRASGGALRTFGLNDTVKEVFDISGFSAILSVFPAEGDALEGF